MTAAFDPFDPKYDDPAPAPETIREFVGGLGAAFAEARAADLALEALRTFGAKYLTRAEARLVEKYGSREERAAVEGEPR